MAKKQNNSEKERFEGLGTKIDPAMAEVLDACCNALGVDVYHLLQWFCYTVIKASSTMHALDPRIQKLMLMLDRDAGWQTAFNLCNPDKLKVSQVVLILEQEGHKGFGAVMVDKPWMGAMMNQTECVDDIIERIFHVLVPGVFRRIDSLKKRLSADSLLDTLLTMIDSQVILDLEEMERAELPQIGDRAENGRAIAYGKRTKRKKHFTPDAMPEQRSIFEDFDRHPVPEGTTLADWEGEHHDTR